MNYKTTVLTCFLCVVLTNQQTVEKDFYQDDYVFNPEHVEVTDYDRTYADEATFTVYKYNRTLTVGKAKAIMKTLITSARGDIKVYRFSNMDFKFTGIHLKVDVCNILKLGLYGVENYKKKVNITSCPIPPRTYEATELVVDSRKLPPLIPAGRYKVVIKGYANNNMKNPAVEGYGVGSFIYRDTFKWKRMNTTGRN